MGCAGLTRGNRLNIVRRLYCGCEQAVPGTKAAAPLKRTVRSCVKAPFITSSESGTIPP